MFEFWHHFKWRAGHARGFWHIQVGIAKHYWNFYGYLRPFKVWKADSSVNERMWKRRVRYWRWFYVMPVRRRIHRARRAARNLWRRTNPLQGRWYWEMQFGPIVVMWQHDQAHTPDSDRGPRIGRLYLWYDTAWRKWL